MSLPGRAPVLVIDDDDGVRKMCLEMLEARGHKTLGAASVAEGLRLFGERHPAAVLLDLKLPDGAGIDVLRELQRRAPGTPVAVISGYGSVPKAVEAMKVGAADFIEKPISRERLFEVVDRILAPPSSAARPSSRSWPTGRATARWGAPSRCAASISW